jgi:triacylglycerol lipase
MTTTSSISRAVTSLATGLCLLTLAALTTSCGNTKATSMRSSATASHGDALPQEPSPRVESSPAPAGGADDVDGGNHDDGGGDEAVHYDGLPVVFLSGYGTSAAAVGYSAVVKALVAKGYKAYAPFPAPVDTIAGRAAALKPQLEAIFTATKAKQIHIVAHSMGGLDARYLISKLGFAGRVKSLTTISTPHRGSAIADAIVQLPTVSSPLISGYLAEFGALLNIHVNSVAELKTAMQNLTTTYLATEFNPQVPDDAHVLYRSYGGAATDGPLLSNPLLGMLASQVPSRQGPGDGLVAVKSAKWGTYVETLEADHLAQIGVAKVGAFDPLAFYERLIKDLPK